MNSPYFSIIIPVYNVEKYLSQCLDSILEQNFKDYELILINDGSSDDSLQICLDYQNKEKKIQVIEQLNGGPSSARNNGLNRAKGKYVMFIDSDDWIASETLQILYEQSQDNCPLIYYGFCAQYGGGDYISTIQGYRHSHNQQQYYSILYQTMENKMHSFVYGFTCNKLFRRDIIEKNSLRFDLSLRIKEDEVFTNQFCASIGEVKIIPYALYNYRMSFGTSISFINRTPSEYEYMADKLIETNALLGDKKIIEYQSQEYIYNLGKGIVAAIRQKKPKEAKRLARKCADKMKEMRLSYNSFNRVHFKDKIRYKYASWLWIYMTSKLFNRFYTI